MHIYQWINTCGFQDDLKEGKEILFRGQGKRVFKVAKLVTLEDLGWTEVKKAIPIDEIEGGKHIPSIVSILAVEKFNDGSLGQREYEWDFAEFVIPVKVEKPRDLLL